jgi:tRNA(Ile)-lysidine synthase
MKVGFSGRGDSSVLEHVLKAISRYNMLPLRDTRRTRVIAAVSGGADSVCLLNVLREIGADVAGVAHFNHKLRGEASDEDERFVTALAARFEIPFYRAEWSAESRALQAMPDANLEQAARRARREFFAQLIREGAADSVALGHTRDDQAETVLFRVLRGSGLAGLAGIHPVTRLVNESDLIRPLIETTRAEVEDYLRSRGIAWREDASNRDPRFARNRIRHQLLPQLAREWNPRITEALANLADLAFEEERWARRQDGKDAGGQEPEVGGQFELRGDELAKLPRAVARRVVRAAIAKAKGDLRRVEFQHIERVIEMEPGRLRLPGVEVTRSFDWIRIAPARAASVDARPIKEPIQPVNVTVPGTYASGTGTGEIRLEFNESPGAACANLKTELAAPIVLRGWRPGDHYRPVGRSRDQKLKEMFQNARIPSWRRRAWPILESGGKILWAREFGPAEEFDASGRKGPVLRVWDAPSKPAP